MKIREALLYGRRCLEECEIEAAERDVEIILALSLKCERIYLHTYPEYELSKKEKEVFKGNIERRRLFEPIAYIKGSAPFYGRDFMVNSDTLIPRPETEILVEYVLKKAKHGSLVLDVGTGSGIIAVTLKLERPDMTVFAGDISGKALAVARCNSKEKRADIIFKEMHLCSDVSDFSLDVIIANLPYVPISDEEKMQRDIIDFEPKIALFSGTDGLNLITELIKNAKEKLRDNGMIALEIGQGQEEKIELILKNNGYNNINSLKDYAGIVRVISGTISKN